MSPVYLPFSSVSSRIQFPFPVAHSNQSHSIKANPNKKNICFMCSLPFLSPLFCSVLFRFDVIPQLLSIKINVKMQNEFVSLQKYEFKGIQWLLLHEKYFWDKILPRNMNTPSVCYAVRLSPPPSVQTGWYLKMRIWVSVYRHASRTSTRIFLASGVPHRIVNSKM